MIQCSGEQAEGLADEAIVCIHLHLEESLLPVELARHLNVSIRTLERGLSAALRCTPGQLILAMKMREARRLLLTRQYRVNEIARRLDFSSPQYFSRCFRSFYRMSPRELLRQQEEDGTPAG